MNKVYTLKNSLPVFALIAVIIGLTACDNPANPPPQTQTQTQTVAAPTASPAAGTYTTARSVTLVSATSGAAIHYTTNGSTPTKTSAVYTSPISIAATTTLKAIAIKDGMTDSEVLTAVYTITPAEPADYYGTWVTPYSIAKVTISANKLIYEAIGIGGWGYTLENITWTVYENPNTEMTTDYPTGYAIKGTVTNSSTSGVDNGKEFTDYLYIKTDKTSLSFGNKPWRPNPTYSNSNRIFTKEGK